jgi:hypothetical protein
VSAHIEKEIIAGRIAGPFNKPPFVEFQYSPVGLVQTKENGQYEPVTKGARAWGVFEYYERNKNHTYQCEFCVVFCFIDMLKTYLR